ncbi:MAG TPA: hypothetical protein DEG69_20705 [Flavobacteriaceae bacterium]|nr:hypothetical protein [Flavobacteriaceae bacterium]
MIFSKKNKSVNHFILAAPRSGTTWLQRLLNAHPEVCCLERRLFGEYADFVQDDGQDRPRLRVTLDKYVHSMLLHHGYPKKDKHTLTQAFIKTLNKVERSHFGKHVIVDKITPYVNTAETVLEQLNTFFPNSKLIYLVRDGRDVLTSGVFHWFNKQPADAELTKFERARRKQFLEGDTFKGRFFQDKEIEQWAGEWMQPLQTIQNAKKSHDAKIIFYEDLLTDTEATLSECLSFLGVKRTSGILKTCLEHGRFSTMSSGRKQGEAKPDAHVRKGISGDWKNYFTYADGKLFSELTKNTLVDFGYEENANWFERLR